MIDVASARINTFGITSPKAAFVSPSEEAVFILASSQLQDIIARAIQEATAPILKELQDLKAAAACQEEKIAALECAEEQDISRVALDIAYDRQRLTKLEKTEPQPLQRDRGEILRALLAANGGRLLTKEARQKMHLSKQLFSMLVASMSDYIETKPLHSDKRKKLLVLKAS
jgi:hypothetical protein